MEGKRTLAERYADQLDRSRRAERLRRRRRRVRLGAALGLALVLSLLGWTVWLMAKGNLPEGNFPPAGFV